MSKTTFHQETDLTPRETRAVKSYFSSFASDYRKAFEGTGRDPLHRVVNRLFRRRTFQQRTAIVTAWLERYGVADKYLIDFGCGSGEVSYAAAQLGARVLGLDIVPEMVALATEGARERGLEPRTEFRVHDVLADPIPDCDAALLIGVVEYYRDAPRLLRRIADATGDLLVIVDTRGPFWRRGLRRLLSRFKGFPLYYRDPGEMIRLLESLGFSLRDHVRGHSFTALAFQRTGPRTRGVGIA